MTFRSNDLCPSYFRSDDFSKIRKLIRSNVFMLKKTFSQINFWWLSGDSFKWPFGWKKIGKMITDKMSQNQSIDWGKASYTNETKPVFHLIFSVARRGWIWRTDKKASTHMPLKSFLRYTLDILDIFILKVFHFQFQFWCAGASFQQSALLVGHKRLWSARLLCHHIPAGPPQCR
jgi:hypothetical protein